MASDERAWLRCRVLAFLHTAYFDDVQTAKPAVPPPGPELVAADSSGEIRGILDITIEGESATIDTIAVHPDHQSQGIGHALLQEATVHLLALKVATLEAWTRDDPSTLRWYRSNGFSETDHYLHVYADYYTDTAEPDRGMRKLLRRLGFSFQRPDRRAVEADPDALRDWTDRRCADSRGVVHMFLHRHGAGVLCFAHALGNGGAVLHHLPHVMMKFVVLSIDVSRCRSYVGTPGITISIDIQRWRSPASLTA